MNNNFSYLTAEMQGTSGTLLVTVLRLFTHKLAVLTVPQRRGVLAQNVFNLYMPNVSYSGRTAPLTSKVAFYIFIQQIQVLNILNAVYTLRLFLFKMQFVS